LVFFVCRYGIQYTVRVEVSVYVYCTVLAAHRERSRIVAFRSASRFVGVVVYSIPSGICSLIVFVCCLFVRAIFIMAYNIRQTPIIYNVWMLHFPLGTLVWHAFTFRPFIFTKQVPQSPWLQLTGILTRALLPTRVSFCPCTTPGTFFPFIETDSLNFGPPESPALFTAPMLSSLEKAPLKASPNPMSSCVLVDIDLDVERDGVNPCVVDPSTRRERNAAEMVFRNIFQ